MKKTQRITELGSFIAEAYGASSTELAKAVNTHFKADFRDLKKSIARWARGGGKPRYGNGHWRVLQMFMKDVYGIDIDYSWVEKKEEPQAVPIPEPKDNWCGIHPLELQFDDVKVETAEDVWADKPTKKGEELGEILQEMQDCADTFFGAMRKFTKMLHQI